ncbi:MAG: MopE-related protein [archaeon]
MIRNVNAKNGLILLAIAIALLMLPTINAVCGQTCIWQSNQQVNQYNMLNEWVAKGASSPYNKLYNIWTDADNTLTVSLDANCREGIMSCVESPYIGEVIQYDATDEWDCYAYDFVADFQWGNNLFRSLYMEPGDTEEVTLTPGCYAVMLESDDERGYDAMHQFTVDINLNNEYEEKQDCFLECEYEGSTNTCSNLPCLGPRDDMICDGNGICIDQPSEGNPELDYVSCIKSANPSPDFLSTSEYPDNCLRCCGNEIDDGGTTCGPWTCNMITSPSVQLYWSRTFFDDNDGDGYGDPTSGVEAETQGLRVTDSTDCDDTRIDIYPGASESTEINCTDTIDNNCDGDIDEDDSECSRDFYDDDDGDGVINRYDWCPESPDNPTDANGCSIPPTHWEIDYTSIKDDRFTLLEVETDDECGLAPPCINLSHEFTNTLTQTFIAPEGTYAAKANIKGENGKVTFSAGTLIAEFHNDQGDEREFVSDPVVFIDDTTVTITLSIVDPGRSNTEDSYIDDVIFAKMNANNDPATELPIQSYYDYQFSGCCPAAYCWNGTACMPATHFDSQDVYYVFAETENDVTDEEGNLIIEEGYRCIADDERNADWLLSNKQPDWYGTSEGFCDSETDCFVRLADETDCVEIPEDACFLNEEIHWTTSELVGEITNPDVNCLADGQYIRDHYCDGGDWTTRTAILAALFERVVKYYGETDADYTLHCDKGEQSLNLLPDVLSDSEYLQEQLRYCVLTFRDSQGDAEKTIVGAPIFKLSVDITNQAKFDEYMESFFDMNRLDQFQAEEVISTCPDAFEEELTETEKDAFFECEITSAKAGELWYNPRLKIAVYSQQHDLPIQDAYETTQAENDDPDFDFLEFITRPFNALFELVRNLINGPEQLQPKEFDQLYENKAHGRSVEGISRDIWTDTGLAFDQFYINFEDISEDLCDPINRAVGVSFDSSRFYEDCVRDLSAQQSDIATYIRGPGRERFWPGISGMLRIQDDNTCSEDGQTCGDGRLCSEGRCVDMTTDRKHCGGWETECISTQICQGSDCVDCPNLQVACDNVCTDTLNDELNCGICFHECDDGIECRRGICGSGGGGNGNNLQ